MRKRDGRKKRLVAPSLDALAGGVRDGDLRNAMPLGQFLTQVGLVMRLPTHPDLEAVAPPTAKTAAPAKPRGTRWWLPLGAVAAVVTAIGALFVNAQDSAEATTAPPELVGTWRTTVREYTDRSLTIEPSAITISVGDTLAQRFPIERVAGSYSREGSRYVIRYRSADGVVDFPVTSQGFLLQMPNPKGVQWTREAVRTTTANRGRGNAR